MAIYKVRDPSGNIREISGPDGAGDDEIISQAKTLFGSEKSVSEIPTPGSASDVKAQPQRTVGEKLLGGAEAGLSLVSGIPAGIAGQAAGIGSTLLSGQYGTQEGIRKGVKTAENVTRALTYAPRTEAGKEAIGSVGTAFEESKLGGLPIGDLSIVGKIQVPEIGVLRKAANKAEIGRQDAAGRGIWKAIDAVRTMAATRAAKILQQAAGADLPAIRASTAAASPGLTATQAASGVHSDVFNALGELAARKDKASYFARLAEQQRQDRLNYMRSLAAGATQTEARQAVEASRKALNQVTSPMREAELGAADIAGKLLAADESLILGEGARFAQSQADSLAAHGFKPLDTDSIIRSISGKLNNPETGVSDINRRVLINVGRKIKEWTDRGGGVIGANALYEIRKNAVNDEVMRLMRGADPAAQTMRAAGILKEVRPLIDDAIEKAGGSGWKNYLNTFEEGARQINQKKMAAKALDLLERDPAKFESLVAGNQPRVVEKVFKTEYDINKAMGNKIRPMQQAAEELKRDRLIKEGAARGEGGLEQVLKENVSKFKLPNWISAKIAITNRALDFLESRVNRKTMDAVYEAMKSGKSANELLNTLPASEKSEVLKAIIRGMGLRPVYGGVISGTLSDKTTYEPSYTLGDAQ